MAAWRRLQEILWPGVIGVAGRFHNAGLLALDDDARKDVALIVVDRLARDDFDGLRRLYQVFGTATDGGWRWICVLAARKAKNYARDRAMRLGADADGMPCFASMIPLSPEAEEMLPASIRGAGDADAHRIMEYAEQTLRAPQLLALGLHLMDEPDDAIAQAMGLPSAHDAYRLWHGAVNRLHYHFVVKGGFLDPRGKK